MVKGVGVVMLQAMQCGCDLGAGAPGLFLDFVEILCREMLGELIGDVAEMDMFLRVHAEASHEIAVEHVA